MAKIVGYLKLEGEWVPVYGDCNTLLDWVYWGLAFVLFLVAVSVWFWK